MKKKKIVAAALTTCIVISATFTGCSLVSTNNKNDMEQVIGTVNISKSDKFASVGLDDYKAAVTSSSIKKRELISYFLNTGYSYVQNNGYTYKDTFNMLMDALVDNAVLVQYSTLEILKDKAKNEGKSASEVVNTFNSYDSKAKKYEYLLGGESSDDVLLAKYNLYSSINKAIDNYEKTLINEDDEYKGTETRKTPTNLNTEQDKYFPKTADGALDYNIYTGYSGYLLADSGTYKDDPVTGTTRASRVKAYNKFLNNLRRNNLVDGNSEAKNLTDFKALKYFEQEYVSQLEYRIINKYYEIYKATQEDTLLEENYIKSVYDEIISAQKESYDKSTSAFESAIDGLSGSSFVLYTPSTDDSDWVDHDGVNLAKYGMVYNILLPFSARQSAKLNELKSIQSADKDNNYYFTERNKILSEITTEDQRTAWFNGETNYSFKVEDSFGDYYGSDAGRDYLFFEGNLTDSDEGGRYEKLLAYDGRYSYNGQVKENEDGSYTLIGNKLDIDGMLDEFTGYVNYVLGANKASYSVNPEYYSTTNFKKTDDEDEIDYSKLVYASGQVDFGTFSNGNLMNPETDQYKAMSAVNELQFAYTTDTGVLDKYIGYSVSAYDTNYIKEFEYAAKLAIAQGGEGSFVVCPGDYGWHLIYVTYTFEAGNNYTPVWTKENIEKKGTFENLFFEWVKGNDLSDISPARRSKIISDFNKDTTVVKYENRYKDLLELDNK